MTTATPYQSARTISAYPHCHARRVLRTMAAGPHHAAYSQFRVDFGKLLQSLDERERAAWDRLTTIDHRDRDEGGLYPDKAEAFLADMAKYDSTPADSPPATTADTAVGNSPGSEDADMAAATAKKPAKKKATKKRPSRMAGKKKGAKKKGVKEAAGPAASNGTARMSKTAASSPTPPLPGMEDIETKIPAIDTAIKRIVDKKAARLALKEEIDAELSKLPTLFRSHDLSNYKAHGRSVSIEHGADVVKIKKVKEQ